jgi:amidase
VAAIGTETDGSIVSPASVNGIVGIKPTVGLVSRAGIIPISHTQDTAGPMARTVADAAAMLTAIAGVDERDSATRAAQGHSERDYTAFLKADGLRGVRIGVARQLFGFHREVDAVMAKAIEVLKQEGAEIVDPVEFPSWRKMGNAELDIMLYELKAGLAAYLATRGDTAEVKSLADVIAFNEKNADKELAVFGQELFLRAQKLGDLGEKRYLDAVERCRKGSREDGIDAVLQKHKLDAILGPTDGPAWKTDWVNGDNYGGGSSSYPAMAGYPHVTVPAGFVRGLPVGVSFFSTAWTEGKLIQYAYAFEQARKARRAPGFEGPKGT